MTGRNMTPKINREDAIREWDRRQAGGARIDNGPAYPQLEQLEQQAQQGRWGTMSYAQGGTGAYTRYAPTQPSSLGQHFQSPPAAVVVDTHEKSNTGLRDAAMSSVRAAAGIGGQGGGGRYDANVPAPPQPAYAAGSSSGRYGTGAVTGQTMSTYQQSPQQQLPSFDSYDHRDGIGTLYAPMQPNTYVAYSSGPQSPPSQGQQATASPQVGQRSQSFYGSAVVSAGASNSLSNFSVVPGQQQLQASNKDSRRMSGMDIWPTR